MSGFNNIIPSYEQAEARNSALQQAADELKSQTLLLNVIARMSTTETMTPKDIQNIVQSGAAPKIFSPGDQIMTSWKDKSASPATEYNLPMDILDFGYVDTMHENNIPAMFIGWHYGIPFGVQFDAREAFYVAPTGGIPAATYHFNSIAWGKITAGDYQFTTTQAHPEGSQFMFRGEYVDVTTGFVGGYVDVYENATSTTVVASYEISSGNGGTKLGDLRHEGSATLNSIQSAMYGYNRYSQSSIRQFLNSDKANGEWWTPKNPYDRPPAELATKHGFLSGFDADFLSIIQPIKVVTAKNTVTDDGGLEETFDTFFPPSLSQMHVTPQIVGEGDVFDYWKKASQSATPLGYYPNIYPHMRIFGIENKNTAQHSWLRSARRGGAYAPWSVYSTGAVNSGYARSAFRVAPVCAIC